MFYLEKARKILATTMTLEKTSIAPNFVDFGHGYMQNAGPEWRGTKNLQYHVYFIPMQNDLKDATLFAYGRRFSY